ncbi:MAG: hypothetical protein HYY16_11890 [Planctomycetes bacterium]|nr:hypothetical protein [Planctomycetota bacterium]
MSHLLTYAVLLAAVQDGQAVPPTTTDQLPEVRPMAGPITLWRLATGKVELLTGAVRAFPNDRLGTRAGAPGRLTVESEVIVTLRDVKAASDEGLSVDRKENKLLIKLYRGSALVETVERDVVVQSAYGRVAGHSAGFFVEVKGNAMRVFSIDGKLTFSNDLGSVELSDGETSTILGKKPPSRPTVAGPPPAWMKDVEAQTNLIANPGFEEGETGWRSLVQHDGKPIIAIDDSLARGGKSSMRIDFPSVELAPKSGKQTPLDQFKYGLLKPGARYLLRLWVRTQDYACNDAAASVRISVSYNLSDAGFGWHGAAPPAQAKWRCARFIVKADSADFRLGICYAQETGVRRGTVWIDDVALIALPAGGE